MSGVEDCFYHEAIATGSATSKEKQATPAISQVGLKIASYGLKNAEGWGDIFIAMIMIAFFPLTPSGFRSVRLDEMVVMLIGRYSDICLCTANCDSNRNQALSAQVTTNMSF